MPIAIYKQKGETPLESLSRLRTARPDLATEKLSYAGRLDPMAEGVMLVLVGEENNRREKYLGLDKTYRTEILFGLSTDTGDALGLLPSHISQNIPIDKEKVKETLNTFVGTWSQKYPTFSSKVFAQAGSFENVRNGKEKVEIAHEVTVRSAELVGMRAVSTSELLETLRHDISKVRGDFRQEEIVARYEQILSKSDAVFDIAEIRLTVSSGFYVRQFAVDLAEALAIPGSALALSIVRERVGDWVVDNCLF